MRPKYVSFEQLVKQNKEELLEDKKRINQIESRLEKVHTDLVSDKRKKTV